MFNVRCWTIATILLAWTFTVSAEITQFSPEDNAVDVCPVPVFGWQDSGNAVAFSVYLSEDQKEISELALPAEDLNNDGKVDYADFLIFSQKTHMPAEQPILKQWVKMANAKNIMNMIILAEPKKKDHEKQRYFSCKAEMLNPGQEYYWRIDTICSDSVVKGKVRRFKVSHAGASEDVSVVLRNPDMGWVLQECYPIQKKDGSLVMTPAYDYPGVDNVMLTCAWSDLENSIGDYNFTDIDYAYDYWRKRGKSMQLRISTEPWGWWSNVGRGLGVPQYVIHALTGAEKQIQNLLVGTDYTLVDARNPFYQERLSAFLKELARHYSVDGPRPVDLVDLLGFGIWGEWHTGFKYENLEERRRALKKIIDIWVDAFGDRWLALSYSHDPQGPAELYKGPVTHYDPASTDTYADYLAYSAFDYALTIPTMTFRRNGCAGTISSNERKLAEEYFKRPEGGLMVSELAGGYTDFKYPPDWNPFKGVKAALDDCLSLHPNFITIFSWDGHRARNFMTQRPDMVDYGLVNMGYRYVPISVKFPQKVSNKSTFTLEFDWVNRGVGKAVQNYDLKLITRKMDDSFVSSQSIGRLNNRLWFKGEIYRSSHEIPIFLSEKGQYKLYIEMTDPRSEQRIQLPLHNQVSGGYFIGLIEVQ